MNEIPEGASAGVRSALTEDPREAKLPAWARNKLREVRTTLSTALFELEAALLKTDPEESDAVLHPYGNALLGTGPIGLGRHAEVRFRLPGLPGLPDHRIRYVDVRVGSHGRLSIMAGRRLLLQPVVSNVIDIEDVEP